MSKDPGIIASSTRRYSFNLRTMLLVVVIIALAIPLFLQSWQLYQARHELRALRSEQEMLSLEDKSKVHVLALDTEEPNTWKWRMYLPKGARFAWRLAYDDIPRDSVPSHGVRGISNEPYWESENEVLVTARLRKLDDDKWRLSVDSRIGDSQHQMHGASLEIPADALRWMWESSSTDGRVLGSNKQASKDLRGPIILLQRRPTEKLPDGSSRPSPEPMPGFMLWLERM